MAGSQLVFSARPTNGAAPPQMDFYIWKDAPPPPAAGQPSGWIDHFQGGQTASDPTLYVGSPNPGEAWPTQPGAYFWQAVYHDCSQNPPQCFVKSPTRSLTITPLPVSPVQSLASGPLAPETYLKRRPRRRSHKRKVTFKFTSNAPGARFQCLFAKGWDRCKSPHIFRRLEPGRYKFAVLAIANGVGDPTPASWIFRILR